MQFIMIDKKILENPNMSNDEIIAYSLLCDRMKSSRRNTDFYDKNENDYFVIFTQNEMAKVLKVSIRKVNSIFKHLVDLGLVKAKKQFSKASLLFLPALEKETDKLANYAQPNLQNLQPNNQIKLNQKTKSKTYTVNTDKNIPTPTPEEIWRQSVTGKIGLTDKTVTQILNTANHDLKRAYQIVKVITNARNSVVNENHLKPSPKTQFESNANIKDQLMNKLKYMTNYLPKNVEEQNKYMTKCLKTFFTEALGIKSDKMVKPICKDSYMGLNRQIPDWMKEKYDPDADKLSISKKRQIQEKLEKLRTMPNKAVNSRKIASIY